MVSTGRSEGDSHDRESTTRVLGLVEGDPASALSGVGHHLFAALDRRLEIVGTVDYGPDGAERAALAAATFRPSRAAWRARFHTSRLSHRTLSRVLARRLEKVEADFDVALQVHGWVAGQPRPYTLFVDQTRLMAERGWPGWMPFTRGERSDLLGLERAMYAEAAHLFVMGGPARESLIDDYGADASGITVVGGGLSFAAVPAPAEPALDPTILFVGREFERKGGFDLLHAFERVRAELPEATLHLVGVSGRIDRAGVIAHGKITDRQLLSERYRRSRVFCLPSRYEPYGLVLVEAMAHGVPCIGTDVQAIPEILDDGRAGVLVPPNDPESLADALLALLTDAGSARRIGVAGRRRVEESLTWDHVAARIAPVLTHLAGDRTSIGRA